MNYTGLSTAIQNYCQNSNQVFLDHINDFIIAAEDKIFLAMSGPFFWKASVGSITVDGDTEHILEAGTLDVLGIRIREETGGTITTGGPFRYLLRKDVDFIYEAYPGSSAAFDRGIPKYYAVGSAQVTAGEPTMTIRFGPTPDGAYAFEVEYLGKPAADSITIGSTPALPLTTTTWLSVTFPDVLLWGAVTQAYTFMKGEADLLQVYESNYNDGLMLLKNMGEFRQNTDSYSDQATGPQGG
jgi:hypothetical protein